jgi:C-terminal processing protease CtpA/Prc
LLFLRESTKDTFAVHLRFGADIPFPPFFLFFFSEILVEPQDDVSTLGDPMFAPGGMLMGGLEKDEMTATVGEDYDYSRQYRQMQNAASIGGSTKDRDRLLSEDYTKNSSANSATMSKLGRMGDSLFSDDASFEQQFAEEEERFDVVAPAGKLGMVIDTPNGGLPVVHAIKDTSVLADSVCVGDRLLSVDGEDCTEMTAMQVSKLISLKSEKPARVLVFARSHTVNTAEP